MDSEVFVLLSGALAFGVPLALAVRELLLRRHGGGDGSWRGDPAPDPPRPPAPAGSGRLPACLVPPPLPRPAAGPRALEDA